LKLVVGKFIAGVSAQQRPLWACFQAPASNAKH